MDNREKIEKEENKYNYGYVESETQEKHKNSFMQYTKIREAFGLNKKKVDNDQRQIEYLQKKQKEISNKLNDYGKLKYLENEIEKNTTALNLSSMYLDGEELEEFCESLKEERIINEAKKLREKAELEKEKRNTNNYLQKKETVEKRLNTDTDTNGKFDLKKVLNNGLVIGNGYNLTKEYLEHKNLTKEENYYNYAYNSNSEKVKKVRKMYETKKENKMEQKEVFLTEAGLLKIEEELKRLKTTEREEIAARIKLAKSYGDLSENGEYDEAKSAQEANETRIAELEYMISQAKIIDESEINTDTVAVGNTVYITNISNNKEQKYTIVGTTESNILQGKISNESPIAKSLLGAKVGDIVQVEAPAGIIEYKIKKITLE